MGSDDVRARAEFEAWQMAWAPKGDECERASIEWDELDTPLARLTNGHVVSLEDEWEAWQASRAALAVAPATAQPGAPTWWARSHDDLPRPTLYATEDAARDAASLDGGKVFPLYAAPPATGDAAAVVDRILDSWGYVDGPDTVRNEVREALHALPLPAPASVQPISDEMRDRLACVTASKSKENPVNDIPRRIRIDLQTPIEAAIRAALGFVDRPATGMEATT